MKTIRTRFAKIVKWSFILVILASKPLLSASQNGPFIRVSLGPGFMNEHSAIKESGLTITTKNHAVGWGFGEKYAVSFSEFGAFIRKDMDDAYRYVNLDAYGAGFAYRTENNINFHVAGAFATVHFSDSWVKQGDFVERGYGISVGIDKKWPLAKRIDLGVGPIAFLVKTENYTFTNYSLNFWLDIYLFAQQ